MDKPIKLEIGPEGGQEEEKFPTLSQYLLNLKTLDREKKHKAAEHVNLNLKEEIKAAQSQEKICIVGEWSESKQGLGRLPMIAAALLIIILLNMGQLMFLGKQAGGETLALAGEAFTTMQDAGRAFISGEDGADLYLFDKAASLLAQVEEEAAPLLAHSSSWLKEPNEIKSIRALLDAGYLFTEIGAHASEARQMLENLPEESSLTDYIKLVSDEHISPAAEGISIINSLLADVDLGNTPYQDSFIEFRKSFEEASAIFDLWMEARDPVLSFLGGDLPQHYLILFQNNDEMRPGGGFIGSFAIAELNDGRLTNLEFNDVYDFDNRYFEDVKVPIHELRQLTEQWRLRDSNISVDFPSSAKFAMDFLDKEGGPGVDGVIAVNLSAAQALMEVSGDLKVPNIDKAISAETFPIVLSTLVEAKVYGDSSPKAILEEVLNAFKDRALSEDVRMDVGRVLLEQMRKKQILIYHKDPKIQKFIESMGVDGSVQKLGELEDDFFMPVFTNIGGNKTDRYIESTINHDTYLMDDGSMVLAVNIERKHNFTEATRAWIKSTMEGYGFTMWNEGLWNIMGDDINETGIRLYLPEGVRFLEAKGLLKDDLQFYYDESMDLSYYYTEMRVPPGESKSFTVFFALPWKIGEDFDEYNFKLYKQPGLKNVTYTKKVYAPNRMMLSAYPFATEIQADADYVLSGPFNNDIDITLLFK